MDDVSVGAGPSPDLSHTTDGTRRKQQTRHYATLPRDKKIMTEWIVSDCYLDQ